MLLAAFNGYANVSGRVSEVAEEAATALSDSVYSHLDKDESQSVTEGDLRRFLRHALGGEGKDDVSPAAFDKLYGREAAPGGAGRK